VTAAPVLDTHAWIWWVEANRRLGTRASAQLDALPPEERPYLCDISLWEVAMLVGLRRLTFPAPLDEWMERATHPRTVRILPITPAIACETARLPASFHRNPADRLIVATCRIMQLPLVTRDRRILRSRLVRSWRPKPIARDNLGREGV
jgi:PIN domain nuclease of toxin-antitoxin system